MTEKVYCKKEPDVLPQEKLNEMKHQYKSISSFKIINQALQGSCDLRKYISTSNKKDELLEYTKSQSLNKYMENLKGKSLKEIKVESNKKIEEYQAGVRVIIEKIKKENIQYISLYNSLLEKTSSMQDEITQLNNHNFQLEKQLNHSEEEINKLQEKFNLFFEFKQLFEELFTEFPNLTTREIIKEIKDRRQEGSKLLIEYTDALNDNDVLRKENANIVSNTKRQFQHLTRRTYEIESEYKLKEANYEKTIIQLENDLSKCKQYKEENIVMHKMLYSVYNLLIETLRLNRNMKENEILDIKETDFTVDMLNTQEIIRYVKIMIQSLHYSSTDKLLRETIAYANMMVRSFMKDKINKKFDPVDIFKEIKKLVETKHERITQLEHCLLLEKEKNEHLAKEIKNNNKVIDLLKRENETIKSTNERATNKNMLSRNKLITIPNTLSNQKEEIYSVNKTEMNKITNQRCISHTIQSQAFSDTKLIKGHKNKITHIKHFSIDNNNTLNKQKKDVVSLNKNSQYQYMNDKSKQGKKEEVKVVDPTNKSSKQNTHLKQEEQQEIFVESSSSSNNTDSDIVEIKKKEIDRLKDIKTGRNKDKLVKSHGFQTTIKYLSDYKTLVDQTNRQIMYRAKMQDKKKVSKLDKLKKRIEKRFLKQLSFDNLNNKMKIDAMMIDENQIKERLLLNIKQMITSIKANDI